MEEILSFESIKEILRTRPDGRVIRRESYSLEFKQDFDWTNRASRVKYVKTIAAFANRGGGIIIFGVSDSPRRIVGITDIFIDLDDAELGSFISRHLTPTPDFERNEHIIDGHRIGAMYIYPTINKPIVCIKDYDRELIESTIYYRYHSRNDKIKPADLLFLLKEARDNEAKRWMELFSKVSSIGVHNVGLFNGNSGEITTGKGKKFILDENLINKLKIIDKYSVEEDGAEAVRIVGDIDQSGAIVTKPYSIHDLEIMKTYIEGKDVHEPLLFLEAICYQSSGILPARYYISKAGIAIKDAIGKIEKVNTRSAAKSKLLSNLRDPDYLFNLRNNCRIDSDTSIGHLRKEIFGKLVEGNDFEILNIGFAKRTLEAILHLERSEYDERFVKEVLLVILNKFYSGALRTQIRQAITYLDLIENFND